MVEATCDNFTLTSSMTVESILLYEFTNVTWDFYNVQKNTEVKIQPKQVNSLWNYVKSWFRARVAILKDRYLSLISRSQFKVNWESEECFLYPGSSIMHLLQRLVVVLSIFVPIP
jgi:hypothetical protein